MMGTQWVAPGKGATVRELLDAAPAYVVDTPEFHGLRPYLERRTSLALTGNALVLYDLDRMGEAFRRVREGEE